MWPAVGGADVDVAAAPSAISTATSREGESAMAAAAAAGAVAKAALAVAPSFGRKYLIHWSYLFVFSFTARSRNGVTLDYA